MNDRVFGIWGRLGLFNLVLVAVFGLLMRYKIAFDFPFFDQRNLLHAHSHFAFGGWITHILYAGLAAAAGPFLPERRRRRYGLLITINAVSAFGMLIAFTMQGYKAVSIAFSTLSIVAAVCFAGFFTKDRAYFPDRHPLIPWALTGLWLNVLAAAGPFTLAYMMATRHINQDVYLGSVYYYLHFQYNGWFFFGAAALVSHLVDIPPGRYLAAFLASVFPAFFLSVLWAEIPVWLYVLTVCAALLQLGAWIGLLAGVWPSLKQLRHKRGFPGWVSGLFYTAVLALTIKFVLQALSVIPSLSQLVFGFRPIVIAYLHLIMLGVYSAFLIGYLYLKGVIRPSGFARAAAWVFLSGVFFNELLLAMQGFAAFTYLPVPYVNEMLLGAAVLLFVGAAGLWGSGRTGRLP